MPLVLIVDDDEKNRKLAQRVLDAGGFETITAATGAEAIALAREHDPDVVLMDLRLPDMDGTEALGMLREDTSMARVPVVAMSALPLDGRDEWLGAVGFAGALGKPIDVGTFADEVLRFCE